MPLQFGISKKLHPLLKNGLSVFIISIVIALTAGYIQLARLTKPLTIEWAGEADSLWIQLDKTMPYSGRLIFVSHTPFGQRLINEYLALNQSIEPQSHFKHYALYSVISADQTSMNQYKYLDYFAFLKLKLTHLYRFLFAHHITTIAPTPNAQPATDVYLKALFTRGLYKQPDNALVDQLRFLVQHSPPGSTIRFSIFLLFYGNENEPLLLDLLAAAERGVNVQILIDLPEVDKPENRGIGYAFQASFGKRMQAAASKGNSQSWIKQHTPVPWDSKNHTKIFLFSDSASFKNWVIVASENLTDTEREKYQAALIMRDQQSYNAFDAYWDQMLRGTYKDLWIASNDTNLTHYFFPQTANEDAIYQQLDQILVSPATKNQGKILISMARWNVERFPLAMKLVELAEKGIKIDIVTRNNPQIVDNIIIKALSHRPNITLHTADVDKLNIHSKYVLFEGYYNDANKPNGHSLNNAALKKILWVGSYNFTGMAMRNNYETWTEVRDDKVFQDFSENFTELKSLVPVDPNSGSIN